MYTRHPEEVKINLREARGRGNTISQLMASFGLARTTIWHIIKDVEVPEGYLKEINSRRGGSNQRKLKNIKAAEMAADELLRGKYREHALIVSMLYWAEGTKKQCNFVNTDGNMIALYVHCLNTLFDIRQDGMIFTLRIFGEMDRGDCLEYWSKILGVQKNKIIVRLNDGGTNTRKHHGMLSILLRRGHFILKTIQALYGQIHEEVLTKDCLRSSTDRTSPS